MLSFPYSLSELVRQPWSESSSEGRFKTLKIAYALSVLHMESLLWSFVD